MAALPRYDEDNWLSKYNYQQLLRIPLKFDQLVDATDYVEGNKSRVVHNNRSDDMATAFSNNIMMAGKHYVSFETCNSRSSDRLFVGVMRPGEAMQGAKGAPLFPWFHQHFTQREGSLQYNNTVNCCMYETFDGYCWSSGWGEGNSGRETWDGMERLPPLSGSCKIGMLLDLDEGTLSVYHNGRKLGVMKRGLAGQYCWVVTIAPGNQISIKRGIVPAS